MLALFFSEKGKLYKVTHRKSPKPAYSYSEAKAEERKRGVSGGADRVQGLSPLQNCRQLCASQV